MRTKPGVLNGELSRSGIDTRVDSFDANTHKQLPTNTEASRLFVRKPKDAPTAPPSHLHNEQSERGHAADYRDRQNPLWRHPCSPKT